MYFQLAFKLRCLNFHFQPNINVDLLAGYEPRDMP